MRTVARVLVLMAVLAGWACGGDEGAPQDPGPGLDATQGDGTEEAADEGTPPDPGTDPGTDPGVDVPMGVCFNGVRDPDESDIDCGGDWCKKCAFHDDCRTDKDCFSGYCSPQKQCSVPACDDGTRNGSETDVDCGGTCSPCGATKGCALAADCKSGVCTEGRCVDASCEDDRRNGDETDVDCGGSCPACAPGLACKLPADCGSALCVSLVCRACKAASECPGADTACRTRTCADGVCGATFAAKGASGGAQVKGDCRQVVCDGLGGTESIADGTDVPDDLNPCTDDSCDDVNPVHVNVADATPIPTQTAKDCKVVVCDGKGGKRTDNDDQDLPVDATSCTSDVCTAGKPSNPPVAAGTACAEGTGKVCSGAGKCVACTQGTDCESGVCKSFQCVAATCGDQVKNGDETDVDCGGPKCAGCATDQACKTGDDCLEGVCVDLVCQAPKCPDGVSNGDETGLDCGGPDCPDCEAGQTCLADTDCLSGHCLVGTCVQCLDAAECPPSPGECLTPACGANACGFSLAAFGTPLKVQTAGDCKQAVCDGQGGTRKMIDDGDLPDDGNDCTADRCQDGVASNPFAQAGTPCAQNGGALCDGVGNCVQCVVTQDCAIGVCVANQCVSAGCTDNVKNGYETDVDCGGTCPKCGSTRTCAVNADCQSGLCGGGICQ